MKSKKPLVIGTVVVGLAAIVAAAAFCNPPAAPGSAVPGAQQQIPQPAPTVAPVTVSSVATAASPQQRQVNLESRVAATPTAAPTPEPTKAPVLRPETSQAPGLFSPIYGPPTYFGICLETSRNGMMVIVYNAKKHVNAPSVSLAGLARFIGSGEEFYCAEQPLNVGPYVVGAGKSRDDNSANAMLAVVGVDPLRSSGIGIFGAVLNNRYEKPLTIMQGPGYNVLITATVDKNNPLGYSNLNAYRLGAASIGIRDTQPDAEPGKVPILPRISPIPVGLESLLPKP